MGEGRGMPRRGLEQHAHPSDKLSEQFSDQARVSGAKTQQCGAAALRRCGGSLRCKFRATFDSAPLWQHDRGAGMRTAYPLAASSCTQPRAFRRRHGRSRPQNP